MGDLKHVAIFAGVFSVAGAIVSGTIAATVSIINSLVKGASK